MTRAVPLGDIADFVNGAAFKPEDWDDSGLPIIRIQNLTDPSKPFNRTKRLVSERLLVRPGDLLVSWSATLGVFEWPGSEDALLNQHIFRVLPDESKVDKRYLRHGLERAIADMQTHLHGATMQHVNRGEFLGTCIHLPALPEQRRIAELLDRAETLRTQRRQALVQLEALAEAIFLDMFGEPTANSKGWLRVPMSELLARIESGHSPVCLDRPSHGDEWAVLKLGAVTRCVFDPEQNKALPLNIEADPSLEVRAGDLLFTRKNTFDLVAACALVRDTPSRLLLPDLIFRLCFREDAAVTKGYLHRLLIYPTKRREIQRLAGGSAGSMPNISKAKLLTAAVELPPMNLQQEFDRRIAAIEVMREQARASLQQLDALFSSLQHRAFRGEL